MEGMELICFNIISAVGSARSDYIEAVHKAKEGKYDEAEALIESGRKSFVKGHKAHAELLAKEAGGEGAEICLMLVHAEDQLMSAESFGILAEEFIDVYRRMDSREQ